MRAYITNLVIMFSILAVLLILNHSEAAGQQPAQTVRGRVVDAYTELPMPGVTLVITGSDPLIGTGTDVDGNFRFRNLPVGRIDIRASFIGYKTAEVNNLLLTSGKELVLEIKLEELAITIDDVIVRPELRKDQPSNEMAKVSARSFTIDETERYAGSLGDPSRMATNFAGVSSVSDQRNDIVIRGNSPLGLMWRLEGVEIPNPNHFGSLGSTGGPISMLNNNQLTNSDFYTSAFPAEYGNALAGAFDLSMRNGNNQKHEFMGQMGFNGFELGAEGPFSPAHKSSYMINFRYSTLEVLHSLGMNFGTGNAIPKYKDISFKLNFPIEKGRISVFGLGGINSISMLDSENDDAQFGFSGTDTYYDNMMGVTGLTWVRYLTGDARITSTLAASGIEGKARIYDLSDDQRNQTIDERMYEIKYTASFKFHNRFNPRNYFNAGAVVDFYDVMYFGRQYVKSLDDHYNYIDSEGATSMTRLFAEWQHRFSDVLSLSSGLHSSVLSLNNTWSLEPRLGLKWEFSPGRSLSLGAGMHSQTQMKGVYFSQRLVDTLNLQYEQTNRSLDMSRALHFVAGYDHLIGKGHRLKSEIYYQRLYDIPVAWRRPEFSIISQGGGFNYWVFDNMENKGTGENYGIEITLEKFLSEGFYYLVTASLFDAGYRGYDGVWRNSAFNNNFVFNALAGYEWKTGAASLLSIDLKTVWAGGNRYLEVDEELSAAANATRFKWDEAYSKRYPDYFRLNGRITFRLNKERVGHE
ncbi:MAG: carboxypeptidase-like regulatory domain-containing protein, partial [Bacteroidales bacterium]